MRICRVNLFKKKITKNFVAIKNRLYLSLLKIQTIYYEQS